MFCGCSVAEWNGVLGAGSNAVHRASEGKGV